MTSSRRVYGTHPGSDAVFLRSGSPGTVDITRAEFLILRSMVESGGLTGDARRMFDGMLSARNAGLTSDSERKLVELFNSRTP